MADDDRRDHEAHEEDTHVPTEKQEEFTSTQQLIKLCKDKEKSTSTVGSNRIVIIKNNTGQQEDTFLTGLNDNYEDQTTTGGDRSLLSEESQVVVKTVDL